MASQPCDQVGTDMLRVQEEYLFKTGKTLKFSMQRVKLMIRDIESSYHGDFREALEKTLDFHLYFPSTEVEECERKAYKRLLGIVFGRRASWKKRQAAKNGRYAPFSPR